jgi:hypothetical protein
VKSRNLIAIEPSLLKYAKRKSKRYEKSSKKYDFSPALAGGEAVSQLELYFAEFGRRGTKQLSKTPVRS